jgi:predicted dehydrogenase
MSATRLQPIPSWSEKNWIVNPELSLGGIVDLQIHDMDFVTWIFGMPKKIKSVGTKSVYGGWEQIVTVLEQKCMANSSIEACNLMPEGYPFKSQMRILFEKGCIEYDSTGQNTLAVYRPGKEKEYPSIEYGDGYQRQIDYFIKCILENTEPDIVTLEDAKNALFLTLKSKESLEKGIEIII